MFECLQEIGYEAELNTEENPELMEMAMEMINEYPSTRAMAITELRKMIFDREECFPYRTDDEFLLRFLRSSKFIVRKAHKMLVRYCTFRQEYKYLYDGVDLWGLGSKVRNAYEGTMLDHPDFGRLTVFRFGTWDPYEFPIDELLRAGMAMTEIGVRQPKLQVLGGTVIVDLEGITLKHITTLTPAVAYQIVCLMGHAVPGRLNSCHFINYSWILSTFFYMFRRFIPESSWATIYFHGYDLKSLHQHINPECLPKHYGGTSRSFASFEVWLKKVKKYRTEEFDKEMKNIGYLIKE